VNRGAVPLLAVLAVGACTRLPPPDGRPAGSGRTAEAEAQDPARAGGPAPSGSAEVATEVEELRRIGPTYIPFDAGPETIWDTEAEAVLSKNLLPVLRDEELPAATKTTYWLLIGADGRVAGIVVQTGSGNASFDAAGAEVAKRLRFRPARRGRRPVAVWVLKEISLLMQ